MAEWLRLCASSAGGMGLIPGQGTRSHLLQLKILHAATKAWCSQINSLKKKERKKERKKFPEGQVDREEFKYTKKYFINMTVWDYLNSSSS